VDLVGAVVGIVHSKLVKLTSNMIGGAGVGVPVIVRAVRGGGGSHSALHRNVLFIKAVPTCGHRMPNLETDMTLRARVGVVGASVVGEATTYNTT
jgi:hypothetical protein